MNPDNQFYQPAGPSSSPNTSGPSMMRFLILLALCVASSSLLLISMKLPWILVVLIMASPIVYLGYKKIEGILLPYAVNIGVLISASILLSPKNAEAHKYLPVLDSYSTSALYVASSGIAISLATVAFFTLNYGPRVTRILSNVLFRGIALWLIFYAFSIIGLVVSNAESKSINDSLNASEKKHQILGIDERLPVYSPSLPASYSLIQSLPVSQGPYINAYQSIYRSSDRLMPDIQVRVSLEELPSSCIASTSGRIQMSESRTLFSCNIVLSSPDGQSIFGYREFTQSQLGGANPSAVSPESIKRFSPSKFYIQKDGALVEISSSAANVQNSPLTAQAIQAFADSLKSENQTARQAFVAPHLRSGEPRELSQESLYDYRPALYFTLAISLYLGLILWSVEKIFIKAGRAYWKVYVPFVNLWILTNIAGKPGWWSLFAYIDTNPYSSANLRMMATYIFLAPIMLPLLIVLTIVKFILFVLVSAGLAKKFGKPPIFSLLLVIPPFPGYLILGFGKSKYEHGWREYVLQSTPGPAAMPNNLPDERREG